MEPLWLQILVVTLTVALIPLGLFLISVREKIQRHEQTLYGAAGNNGHSSEIASLRDDRHEANEDIRLLKDRTEELGKRLDRGERGR